MIFLRHTLEALINPFFILLALFFLFTMIGFYSHYQRLAHTGFFIVLAMFILLSTGFFPQWLTRHLEGRFEPVATVNPNIRFVVVLSGGQAQYAQGMPAHRLSVASMRRLIEGIRLYRQLPQAKLVLSGGRYQSTASEAELMKEIAVLSAISSQRIVMEEQSVNTADQAVQLKKILTDEPFYLVTSAIHMKRAVALCRKQGLNPVPAPTDYTYYWNDERWQKRFIPNPNNLVYVNIAWHEILGHLWERLRGDI